MYSKDRTEGSGDKHYVVRMADGSMLAFTQKGLIKTAVINNMIGGDKLDERGEKIQQIIDDFNQSE